MLIIISIDHLTWNKREKGMFWNLFLQQVHLRYLQRQVDLIQQYFSRLLLTLLKNKHKTFNGSFDLPLISLVLEFAFFSNAYTQMVKWKDFILFSSSAFERKENLCGMPNTVTIVMNIKFWNLHSYKYARNCLISMSNMYELLHLGFEIQYYLPVWTSCTFVY